MRKKIFNKRNYYKLIGFGSKRLNIIKMNLYTLDNLVYILYLFNKINYIGIDHKMIDFVIRDGMCNIII